MRLLSRTAVQRVPQTRLVQLAALLTRRVDACSLGCAEKPPDELRQQIDGSKSRAFHEIHSHIVLHCVHILLCSTGECCLGPIYAAPLFEKLLHCCAKVKKKVSELYFLLFYGRFPSPLNIVVVITFLLIILTTTTTMTMTTTTTTPTEGGGGHHE